MTTAELKNKLANVQQLHQQTAAHLLKLEGAAAVLSDMIQDAEKAEEASEGNDTEAPL